MTQKNDMNITRRVIQEQFYTARKKREAAEVRYRNAMRLESDLLSCMKEIGYYKEMEKDDQPV